MLKKYLTGLVLVLTILLALPQILLALTTETIYLAPTQDTTTSSRPGEIEKLQAEINRLLDLLCRLSGGDNCNRSVPEPTRVCNLSLTDVAEDVSDYRSQIVSGTDNVPVPSLRVTYPNGGETITRGSTQEVTWSGGKADWKLNIFLIDTRPDYAVANSPMLVGGIDNQGHYTVAVPPTLTAGSYKVRVACQNCLTFPVGWLDDSDNAFIVI